MALTVGELVGYLKLDKSNWDRGMTSAEGDAKKSGGWLSGLAKGAGILGGALGAAGIAGGIMGLKTAAGLQNAQIAFETMLGSGEKARAFLDDLKDFAAKTPFEFPELQTAASSLISAGFEASQVIPIMTSLGDITSGMGTGSEGIKRATVALQQMAAAGKITAEDLNQLRDAGVPVFDLLSAATGKTKEEIAAMAAAGKLGKEEMQQLFDALEQGKGLEKFTGLMEKQSQSLGGIFSTVKDSIQMGLADAIMPLVPLLTTLLPKAAEIFSGALKWLSGVIEGVIGWFTKAGKAGVQGLGWWRPAFDAVKRAVMSFWAVAGGVFDKIKAFWTEWGPVLVKWLQTNIPKAVAALSAAFKVVGKAIGGVIDFVSDLVGWFHEHEGAMDALKAVLVGLGAGFLAYKAIMLGVSAVTKAWAAIQAVLNAVLAANPIALIVIAIAALAAGLIYAYKHSETFRDIVDGVFQAVSGFIKGAWENVIKPVIDALVAAFTWVITTAQDLWAKVTAFWSLLSAATGAMKDAIVAAFTAAVEWISGIPGKIVAFLSGMWTFVKTEAGEMKDGVIEVAEGVVDWFKGLPGLIVDALYSLGRTMYDAGKRIINMLWDGLKSAWGAVVDWFSGIWQWVTDHLPGSPVKVGPLRVLNNGYAGAQIGKMLADGMLSQTGAVRAAAAGLAGAAHPGGLSMVGSRGSGTDRLDATIERAYLAGRTGGDGGAAPTNLHVQVMLPARVAGALDTSAVAGRLTRDGLSEHTPVSVGSW